MFAPSHFRITLQTTPDEDAQLSDEKTEELLQAASRFRGDVINQIVVIEGKVDQCLANYFCDDHKKKDDLLWLVLRQRAIGFSSKLGVLSAITKDTSIQADADYLNSVRNAFAHSVLVYDVPNDQLKLWDGENLKFVVLSDNLQAEIDEYVTRVDEFLNRLLAKQETGHSDPRDS
jgi:hypothetical protein